MPLSIGKISYQLSYGKPSFLQLVKVCSRDMVLDLLSSLGPCEPQPPWLRREGGLVSFTGRGEWMDDDEDM